MKIFVCLIYIFICTYSENPLEYLNKKFERKLDINLYFHKNVKRQTSDSFKCDSKDGPYCNFLNSKMLGSKKKKEKFLSYYKMFRSNIIG